MKTRNVKITVNLAIKRFFDFFFSLFGLIISTPIWIIAAIAIKTDSKGPVIFKQNRMTKDGKTFVMYKFRSMKVDADKSYLELFSYEGADPRVTRVGSFLRKTSLDELPQLINILKGDISLVGPRPAVEGSLGPYKTMNSRYKKRFSMQGGITGLAQVRGRNAIDWDEKVRYDGEYVDLFAEKGIIVDIMILIETVKAVLCGNNINEMMPDGVTEADEQSIRKAAEERIRRAQEADE